MVIPWVEHRSPFKTNKMPTGKPQIPADERGTMTELLSILRNFEVDAGGQTSEQRRIRNVRAQQRYVRKIKEKEAALNKSIGEFELTTAIVWHNEPYVLFKRHEIWYLYKGPEVDTSRDRPRFRWITCCSKEIDGKLYSAEPHRFYLRSSENGINRGWHSVVHGKAQWTDVAQLQDSTETDPDYYTKPIYEIYDFNFFTRKRAEDE
jgi:hypothetical protein